MIINDSCSRLQANRLQYIILNYVFYFCVSSHVKHNFSSAVNHLIFILPCAAVIVATLIFISVSVCCPALHESCFMYKTLVSDSHHERVQCFNLLSIHIFGFRGNIMKCTIHVCPLEADVNQKVFQALDF